MFWLPILFHVAAIAAQAPGQAPDLISGGAGWAGAGLLGLVLGWLLMVHLPALAKLQDRTNQVHTDTVEKIIADCRDDRIAALEVAREDRIGTIKAAREERIMAMTALKDANLAVCNQLDALHRDSAQRGESVRGLIESVRTLNMEIRQLVVPLLSSAQKRETT